MKINSPHYCPECQAELVSVYFAYHEYVLQCQNRRESSHKMRRYDIYYDRLSNLITSIFVVKNGVQLYINYYNTMGDTLVENKFIKLEEFSEEDDLVIATTLTLNQTLEFDWQDVNEIDRKIKFLLTFQ